MEFHIRLSGSAPDPDIIEDAIRSVDPSALVDIDPASATLRIAASVSVKELVALIGRTGLPVAPSQVTHLPSMCCAGSSA
jgi:hypothetical protein